MKSLRILGLAAIAAVAGFAVQAAEVRKSLIVSAPPAAVWTKIGDWCAIKDWHPAIANCVSESKTFRTLTLKDGGIIVERQTQSGRHSYSYEIASSPLPVRNYSAVLTAKPAPAGTEIVWTAKFDPAAGKTPAEAESVIAGTFDAGLNNIKSNVKFDGATASGAAPAVAIGTATAAAASKIAADAAARDEARLKAREERRKRFEAAKAAAFEKAAKAKVAALEKAAQVKALVAEKAKVAAEAAKVAYEKAKAALTSAATSPAPAPKKP